MGRTPKYDWSDKRDICHKLYVEQKLPCPKIVEYFADHFKLPESELPAARDFQRQFRKWSFPERIRKLNPDEEFTLKERMRELFKENLRADGILEKLNEEGWELDEYRFNVFRRRFGFTYRTATGDAFNSNTAGKKRKGTAGDAVADENEGDERVDESDPTMTMQPTQPPLPPEEAARRAQRRIELQIESDQLMQAKKRRRRIRGIGHLPADAPGMEPRYASETSLDECKAYLHLTNEVYTQLRTQYEAICTEMGVIKKSLCAEGQWQESKSRLIRENIHLASVLHPLQPDIDKRTNALDCICADVTKRMRDMQKRLTVADASNVLGLNPLQSKQIRRVLYEILEADQFTTVFECGKERYEELQQQWYAKVPVLQQAVQECDPLKLKAITVLTKDGRKRYCDDQVKKSNRPVLPHKGVGPGPGPVPGTGSKKKPLSERVAAGAAVAMSAPATTPSRPQSGRQTLIPLGPAWEGQEPPRHRMSTLFDLAGPDIDFDLDPLLTRTTHGPPWPPPAPDTTELSPEQRPSSYPAPSPVSIAAYFRLASNSQLVGHHPQMWLGKLAAPNIDELKKAATAKAGAARVAKIHGVVKSETGSEDSWLIENDDELAVYLGEAGEKSTFVVLLRGGYA